MGVTPAKQWKNKISVEGMEVTLPSGNVCLARRLSPEAFLQSGFMPDPLTAIVQKSINDKRGLPPSALEKMTEDPKKIGQALETFDRVLSYCVVEPKIEMPPGCSVEIEGEKCGLQVSAEVHQNHWESGKHTHQPGGRDEEVLYSDEVDMTDKIFVFQWALGGTSDLVQFHKQQSESVDAVSNIKDVQPKAKRTSRAKQSV